jgi:cytochrome P450
MPFSMGGRNCVGQALARLEILLVMVKLLGNYTFQLPGAGDDPSAALKALMGKLETRMLVTGAPGVFSFEWTARAA